MIKGGFGGRTAPQPNRRRRFQINYLCAAWPAELEIPAFSSASPIAPFLSNLTAFTATTMVNTAKAREIMPKVQLMSSAVKNPFSPLNISQRMAAVAVTAINAAGMRVYRRRFSRYAPGIG